MSDLNQVQIIGRLGADPEIRYMPSGSAVTNIRVATTEKWKDRQTGDRKEKTEWHNIVFFGKLAEIAGEYLEKGRQVFVQGRLQTDRWEDKQGTTRYTTKIIANQMQMLGEGGGSRQQHSAAPAGPAPTEEPPQAEADFDDDIPF